MSYSDDCDLWTNLSTAFVISLLIILKFIEIILKQFNQRQNYNQQNEKIKIMNESSEIKTISEDELNKKITDIAETINKLALK